MIGRQKIQITSDVIDSEISLLLSKDSMKQTDSQIDFSNDEKKMLTKKLKLQFTASGHYSTPISNSTFIGEDLQDCEKVLLNISSMPHNKKANAANELHKQFPHLRSDRLIKLVKDAGVTDNEFINSVRSVESSCDTCQRYKKPALRPVVGFSLAKVSMRLLL